MVDAELDGAAQHRDPVLRVAGRAGKVPVGSRIVPKPSRATGRSPPIAKVPEAAAGWLVLVAFVMLTACPGPAAAARSWQVAAICRAWTQRADWTGD